DFESASPLVSSTLVEGSQPWAVVDSSFARSPTHVASCPSEDGRKDATLAVGPMLLSIRPATLVFWHLYRLETGFDGARIGLRDESTGDVTDLARKIREGAYAGSVGAGNPMGAGPAWTGASGPSLSRVTVDLGDWTGRPVSILFRIASDESLGGGGWLI